MPADLMTAAKTDVVWPDAPRPLRWNPVRSRFTVDGSPGLEHHLARMCQQVLADVRRLVPAGKLDGLLLGGGYGRGEGGVLRTPAGDEPYNDMEYYVCLRGHPLLNESIFDSALAVLGRMLAPIAGVDVDFKILSLRRLRSGPVSMFSYDLVMGHHWLLGEDRLLAGCEHHSRAEAIPLHEATRLLMNRCTGLLFARQRLARPSLTLQDAGFIARNLAKAQLAFGDAVLAALGQYHWSCRERGRRLESLPDDGRMPWLGQVKRHHRDGVAFKLHPVQPGESTGWMPDRLEELVDLGRHVWLWLESLRLRHPFASIEEYVASPVNKCPETNPWKNLLINFRVSGLSPLLAGHGHRYPREQLLLLLAALLWGDHRARTTALDDPGQIARLLERYEALWRRFR